MPVQLVLIATFGIVVFGSLALLFLQLALKPGREAERAVEVVQRNAQKRDLADRKKWLLDRIASFGQQLRTRFHLAPNEALTRKLATAGFWNANAIDFFLAGRIICIAVFAWLGSLLPQNTLMCMCAFGTVGYIAPKMWLDRRISKRKERIRRDLPDAIDLLVICVDAGLGLDQAVLRVSDELNHSHPVLRQELQRVHFEQRAGRTRHESWQSLADRTALPEVASLVNILVQSDRFGTQVAKALGTFADDIRQQQRQRAEEAVARLKIKIIFPLVFLIFPCLFIVILGPAALNIAQELQNFGK